ncbi:MAG: glycosyltransferase [Bacteroidales bacterium]|nr:glycosyltransferase [Bacteroidales bacterium]
MAVINDLVTDQRVDKTCTALTEAGYDVTLIGRLLPGSKPVSRNYKTSRMRLLFRKKAVFYAEYNVRLLFKLLFSRANMFYSNDVDTLPACAIAAKLRRKKLFFDAHELFSEVPELVCRGRVKRVWQWVERHFIPCVDGAMTVCQSVADEYRNVTGVRMDVVRNLALYNPVPATKPAESIPRILLYQGAVNIGRGIDWLIEAMGYLEGYSLVIAGDGDVLDEMKALAKQKPWAERIVFLGRVVPDELHKLTKTASLGMVLLENMGLNYYYSLPNRVGDFLQAGVPIVATDFPEIASVVNKYSTGSIIGNDAKRPRLLAEAIKNAVAHWDAMPADEYAKVFERAKRDLCWENEKKVFLKLIDTIFSQK